MSSSLIEKKSYRYGMTGWVELSKRRAKKYMILDEMYWIREYTTLMYLWKYNHSNIIRHDDCGYIVTKPPNKKTQKVMYFKLEFPNYGETLSKCILHTDKDILQIMVDLLSAISLCHKLNIWHRDIKPNNILITSNMRAILIDFTHSVRIRSDDITLDPQIATYSHRAPEVFEYKAGTVSSYDEKIDIFALGVILYEIVTGKTLYTQIRDHTEEEIESFYTNQTEYEYINEIRKLYYKNKRTVFWIKKYWEWIEFMLTRDPHKRPSAEVILKEMFKFAKEKEIHLEIPEWTENDTNSINTKSTNKIVQPHMDMNISEDNIGDISEDGSRNGSRNGSKDGRNGVKDGVRDSHSKDNTNCNTNHKNRENKYNTSTSTSTSTSTYSVDQPISVDNIVIELDSNDVNNLYSKINKEDISLNESQIELVEYSIKYAKKYIKAYGLFCNINKLIPIIDYLIYKKTIINNNYKEMVLALCICVNNVIYDCITEIQLTITAVMKKVNHPFNALTVINCIILLLNLHEEDLFLYDRFDF